MTKRNITNESTKSHLWAFSNSQCTGLKSPAKAVKSSPAGPCDLSQGKLIQTWNTMGLWRPHTCWTPGKLQGVTYLWIWCHDKYLLFFSLQLQVFKTNTQILKTNISSREVPWNF